MTMRKLQRSLEQVVVKLRGLRRWEVRAGHSRLAACWYQRGDAVPVAPSVALDESERGQGTA